jgi:hypothetical protein
VVELQLAVAVKDSSIQAFYVIMSLLGFSYWIFLSTFCIKLPDTKYYLLLDIILPEGRPILKE